MVSCFRVLVYGDCCDRNDEYLQLSESSTYRAMKAFTKLVIREFGAQYLNRSPTEEEKLVIIEKNKCRGFPGAFAS